ncbi:MAG: DUF3080 family protein [Halioglobus sp.]|nr:DUF3080 family protein [Halioglobus sp.]
MRHGFLRRLQPGLLFATMLLAMSGCQPDAQDTARAVYLRKLSLALPTAGHTMPHARRQFLFSNGVYPVTIPIDGFTTVDLLTLQGCALKQTLIRESSLLGQHATAAQRILLVLEFLHLAPACSSILRQHGNHLLASRLERLWHHRRRHLPAYLFNATLAGDAYPALWTRFPGPRLYPPTKAAVTIAALHGITALASRWLSGDYRANNRHFELLLGEVAADTAGERLLKLRRQERSLAIANQWLRQQLQTDPLCNARRNRRETRRLLTSARRAFRSKIETRFNESLTHLGELELAVSTLEKRLYGVSPLPYRRWTIARKQHLDTLRQAPALHQMLLDRVKQSCA